MGGLHHTAYLLSEGREPKLRFGLLWEMQL